MSPISRRYRWNGLIWPEVRSAWWNRVRRGRTVWRRKDGTDTTRWHTCRTQPPNVSNLIYGWRREPTATPFLRTTSSLLSVSLSPLFPPHFNHLTANIRFPCLLFKCVITTPAKPHPTPSRGRTRPGCPLDCIHSYFSRENNGWMHRNGPRIPWFSLNHNIQRNV